MAWTLAWRRQPRRETPAFRSARSDLWPGGDQAWAEDQKIATPGAPAYKYDDVRSLFLEQKVAMYLVIAGILGNHGANIVSMDQVSRDGSFHTFHFDIEVHDVQHLMRILAALRATDVVSTAERL